MILSNDVVSSIFNGGLYDCSFVTKRFVGPLVESPSPYGDIITFSCPSKLGELTLEESVVICCELPNADIFGGVCFQRLFLTQLGSLMSAMFGHQAYVDQNVICVDDKQCSLSITSRVKDSAMINIFFPQKSKQIEDKFYFFSDDEEKVKQFQTVAIESFNQLTKSIFNETRRDNF